jgi:hypothetical protein
MVIDALFDGTESNAPELVSARQVHQQPTRCALGQSSDPGNVLTVRPSFVATVRKLMIMDKDTGVGLTAMIGINAA